MRVLGLLILLLLGYWIYRRWPRLRRLLAPSLLAAAAQLRRLVPKEP
jgi:hypothetical protein